MHTVFPSHVFSRREICVHGIVVMLVGLVKSLGYYPLLLLFLDTWAALILAGGS